MKKANDLLRRNVVSIDGDDFSVMDFVKTIAATIGFMVLLLLSAQV